MKTVYIFLIFLGGFIVLGGGISLIVVGCTVASLIAMGALYTVCPGCMTIILSFPFFGFGFYSCHKTCKKRKNEVVPVQPVPVIPPVEEVVVEIPSPKTDN